MADVDYQLDIELIKKRAIAGVVTFTLRTFFVQIFTFAATFALTVLLNPNVFGIFFVVSACINFFVYFSDIGLAAALIQKKETLTKDDLKTTFTIQQCLIFALVIIGLFFSRSIANFYHLDHQGLNLLRVLILSLVLSSLKTIPSIILERNLNFTKLVIPQILENMSFYLTAVVLAYKGFGIESFTWAVLVRGLIGLTTVYILAPWKPSIGINKESAKHLTKFGLPFQINSILALLKDDFMTIFLGKILDFSQVGYIGWAQKWAFIPLRFFMDNVNKVTFPAYSRLQDHTEELEKAIEKSIFFVTFLVYPTIFAMFVVSSKIIEVVPHYQKWQPALPLLYLFGINALFSAVSTTFTNTLFAIGKPKIVLKFMLFWTTATWLLTLPLVKAFGYVGVGVASALIASTSIATIYFIKKNIKIKIRNSVLGPLSASLISFVVSSFILKYLPTTFMSIILVLIIFVIIYSTLSLLMFKKLLVKDFKSIMKSFLQK